MTGIDILTRDMATMPNGTIFVTHAHVTWGDDCPVSGDELARMRAEDGIRAL